MDTIIELRENEFNHALEWIILNQTMETPRRGHVMFMVSNNICDGIANNSIVDPITIDNVCEIFPNDNHVEKASLQWTVIGSIILISIIVVIMIPFTITYYWRKKKSESEDELEVIHQNFNRETSSRYLLTEKNPGYEATEANSYEEEVKSLPLINIDQIQKGKIIGNKSSHIILICLIT